MPIGVVFYRINVDSLVRPAMHRYVSLAIAVEIEGPQVGPTGHRGFEDAGRNRLSLPLHRPGQPHIDGNDPHRPWPPLSLRVLSCWHARNRGVSSKSLHDAILRLRKSRMSGTISSALSSSAKCPVSIR